MNLESAVVNMRLHAWHGTSQEKSMVVYHILTAINVTDHGLLPSPPINRDVKNVRWDDVEMTGIPVHLLLEVLNH